MPGDLAALGTTVSIWAHPDDETYLAGGVMGALRDRGQRVVCVTATRGDGGNGLDRTGTPEQRSALGRLRSRELDAALRELGVTEHHWLDYPDGGLADASAEQAVARLTTILDDVAAETVLTFGPDGFTGHSDHRAVAGWAAAAVVRTARPVRLLQAVVTAADAALTTPLDELFDVYVDGGPPVVADEEIALRLVLADAELDRKVTALRKQASQTAEIVETVGAVMFARWVAAESFREVVPLAG